MSFFHLGSNFPKQNSGSGSLNIDDFLVVTKIEPESLSNKAVELKFEDSLSEVDEEHKKLDEQAICKRQQQLLLADERGKLAIIAEIDSIKRNQKKRVEALKNRQQALEIEKERAKWISSLPPPLPKSVKDLLHKKSDVPKIPCKPDVKMPIELTAVAVSGVHRQTEDKENILDPQEVEVRKKMQEEWDLKAQKRFQEALKKDRQKEECVRTMKQIQTAELQHRKDMAKSFTSEKANAVPCPLSDKFQTIATQAAMEDAAEKILRKRNKEHVIDDIEGYQDLYDTKYKNIDSKFEEKMIDCVPNFIKENFEYLLEDDSSFTGGQNFSPLNDSGSDVLNRAYIETPPSEETGNKLDLAIDKLDQLRSNFQAQYDQTLKPLLVAAMEVPKKVSVDKAIETDFTVAPAEDKAVETDISSALLRKKILDTKVLIERQHPPFLPSYEVTGVPAMHHKPVFYNVPSTPQMLDSSPPSWSSSSYCSLPSKHGFPSSAGQVKCDICAAERELKLLDRTPESQQRSKAADVGHEASKGPDPRSSSPPSSKPSLPSNPALSQYVKELAKKYLKEVSSSHSIKTKQSKSPEAYPEAPAFEPVRMESFYPSKPACKGYFSEPGAFTQEPDDVFVPRFSPLNTGSNAFLPAVASEKCDTVEPLESRGVRNYDQRASDVQTGSLKYPHNGVENEISGAPEVYQSADKDSKAVSPSSKLLSEADLEAMRLRAIQQVLGGRFPRFDFSTKPTEVQPEGEDSESTPSHIERGLKPFVYHELSTIQEVDSALTAGSLQMSQSLERSLDMNSQEKSNVDKLDKKEDSMKSVSLLDPPSDEISELARSIHFVPKQDLFRDINAVQPKHFSSTPNISRLSVGSTDNVPLPRVPENASSYSSFANSAQKPTTKSSDPSTLISGYLRSYRSDISANGSTPSQKLVSGFITDEKELHAPQDIGYLNLVQGDRNSDRSSPNYAPKSEASLPIPKFNLPAADSVYLSTIYSTKAAIKPETEYKIKSNGSETNTNNYPLSKYVRNHNEISASSDSFYPLTSQSDTSTPSIKNPSVKDFPSGSSSELSTSEKGSFQPLTPQSNVSTPSSFFFGSKSNKTADSKESFQPLTLCSNVSTPSDCRSEFSSEKGSFKPLTPISNVSTPSSSFFGAKSSKYMDSKESFKPLTPCSDVSTPSEFKSATGKGSFQPWTPQSNVSTPSSSSLGANSGRDTDSKGSFKPLTICSDVSTPSYLKSASGKGNFHPWTPQSNVSTPSSSSSGAKSGKDTDSKESFKPLTPCSDVSTPPDSKAASGKGSFQPSTPQANVPNSTLKNDNYRDADSKGSFEPLTPCSDVSTPSGFGGFASNFNLQKPAENEGTSVDNNYNAPYYPFTAPNLKRKPHHYLLPFTHGSAAQVPKIVEIASVSETESKSDSKAFEKVSEQKFQEASHPDMVDASTKDVPGKLSSRNDLPKASGAAEDRHSSSDSSGEIFKKPKAVQNSVSRRHPRSREPNHLQSQRAHGFSSTSSSSENLSDMFSGSKINYQSTPIKSLEEEMQHAKLISDESLTLVTLTQLTSHAESPENLREASADAVSCQAVGVVTAVPGNVNLHLAESSCNTPKAKVDCSTDADCNTPTNQSPQVGHADTPSMISFLHHETECLQEATATESPMIYENLNPTLSTSEGSMPVNRGRAEPVAASQKCKKPPQGDYKQRTRRLWNNLEEVKKRNLAQDRQKLMMVNRIKAREYAKKLTPKRKN